MGERMSGGVAVRFAAACFDGPIARRRCHAGVGQFRPDGV